MKLSKYLGIVVLSLGMYIPVKVASKSNEVRIELYKLEQCHTEEFGSNNVSTFDSKKNIGNICIANLEGFLRGFDTSLECKKENIRYFKLADRNEKDINGIDGRVQKSEYIVAKSMNICTDIYGRSNENTCLQTIASWKDLFIPQFNALDVNHDNYIDNKDDTDHDGKITLEDMSK